MSDDAGVEPIEILLIEDDPGDALLTREAFADHKLYNRLVHIRDGRDALKYLGQEGEHAGAALPGLILLDLNLPGIDGRKLLDRIVGDPHLRGIPVVVLTSSLAERDILRARQLNVAGYVCKPVDFERLIDLVRQLERFALIVVRASV